jgi:SPP1 gp7 family putative phage head morphogenesis protein
MAPARVRPLKRKPLKRALVTQPPPRVALYTAQYTRRLVAFLAAWYDHVETVARHELGERADARSKGTRDAYRVVQAGVPSKAMTREVAERKIAKEGGELITEAQYLARFAAPLEAERVRRAKAELEASRLHPASFPLTEKRRKALEKIVATGQRAEVAATVGRRAVLSPVSGHIADQLRTAYETVLKASGLEDFVRRMGGDIMRKQRGYVQRVTKIPPAYAPGRQDILERFRRENVSLITRMGEDQLSQVGDILRRAQSTGSRWEDIAPEIQGRLGVGKSRAKLIARDQTNKFNSSAQQATQREAGITSYRWSTSKDSAVRGRPGGVYAKSKEDHWALEGKIFSWSEPPLIPGTSERAHPGERIQCRCVAIPVVPLFEET